jgi:hypothetical protein
MSDLSSPPFAAPSEVVLDVANVREVHEHLRRLAAAESDNSRTVALRAVSDAVHGLDLRLNFSRFLRGSASKRYE